MTPLSTSEQPNACDNTHAAKLLLYRFGEREGLHLLWNETCFPMDGPTALAQARELISTSEQHGLKLTKQQARAMQAFRSNGGTATGGCVWGEGVCPWPTMSNLETKGLIVATAWLDEDVGYEYSVTSMGAEWLIAQWTPLPVWLTDELRLAGQQGDVEWGKRNV